VATVTVKLYLPDSSGWPYQLKPERLFRILNVETSSEKQMTALRVKQLLRRTFPPVKFFYLFERSEGWLTNVELEGIKYHALVLRTETNKEDTHDSIA
jgi:hypothetical protein